MPCAASSVVTSFLTSGRHEPQLVPALVHALTAPRSVHAVVGDRAADGAGRDVVARADGGVVGKLQLRRSPAALGQQERGRVAGQLAAEHRAQARVRAGVADEDAAEQGAGVVGHDELLVDAAHRVGPDDLQGARRLAERVAEAGDVDARRA